MRVLSDAVLASRPAVTPAELAEACKAVAAMSRAEFMAAARAIGLLDKQAAASKPRKQRTALVNVVPKGETFTVECGWCGWSTKKPQTFHAAQLAAHRHNHHEHRDHCVVNARVA